MTGSSETAAAVAVAVAGCCWSPAAAAARRRLIHGLSSTSETGSEAAFLSGEAVAAAAPLRPVLAGGCCCSRSLSRSGVKSAADAAAGLLHRTLCCARSAGTNPPAPVCRRAGCTSLRAEFATECGGSHDSCCCTWRLLGCSCCGWIVTITLPSCRSQTSHCARSQYVTHMSCAARGFWASREDRLVTQPAITTYTSINAMQVTSLTSSLSLIDAGVPHSGACRCPSAMLPDGSSEDIRVLGDSIHTAIK